MRRPSACSTQAELDRVPVHAREVRQHAELLRAQAAVAVGLDVVGDHRVHQHRHVAEHVVEDVGLLEVVELVRLADEAARRESGGWPGARRTPRRAPGPARRRPASRCASSSTSRQAAEVGDAVGADRQRAHAGDELVAGAAGQQLASGARTASSRPRAPRRVVLPALVDGPVGASRRRRPPAVLHVVVELPQHASSRCAGSTVPGSRRSRCGGSPRARSSRAGSPCRRPRGSVRVSPLASCSGCLPPAVSSSSEPPWSGVGPGQRAGAEQVAGLQVAAVDRVMRDQLRDRPVGVAEVRAHQALAGMARRAHRGGLQPDLELDVERAVLAVVGASRGRAAAAGSPAGRANGRAKRRQRFQRDDPRRERAGEVLRQERARAAGTPSAWMSRALQSLNSARPKTCSSASRDRRSARPARCRGR